MCVGFAAEHAQGDLSTRILTVVVTKLWSVVDGLYL